MEGTMFGRRAVIVDWAAEQDLNDAFATDRDGEGAFGRGAHEDGAARWSYGVLDTSLSVQASPLPVDGYRQSGWLAFA
jgi:hypothetical protein